MISTRLRPFLIFNYSFLILFLFLLTCAKNLDMLRISTILLMFSVFFFYSCDDDSSSESTGGNDLVGTWEMVEFTYTGTSVSTVMGQSFTSDFNGEGKDMNYTFEFKENPMEYEAMGSYTIALTVTGSGQTFTFDVPVNVSETTGNWSADGMTLTTSNGLVSYSVDGSSTTEENQESMADYTLNGDNLEFRTDDSSTTTDPSTGTTTRQEVQAISKFMRIN